VLTPKRVERLWSRIDRRGDDECWPWTGRNRTVFGYGLLQGTVRYERYSILAHRAVWACAHTRTPAGLICHTCDNPGCCNPAHLYEGTYASNARDMYERARVARSLPPRDYLAADKELAWQLRLDGKTCAEAAAIIGCCKDTVSLWTRGVPFKRRVPKRWPSMQ
jgi:hypothetical protein